MPKAMLYFDCIHCEKRFDVLDECYLHEKCLHSLTQDQAIEVNFDIQQESNFSFFKDLIPEDSVAVKICMKISKKMLTYLRHM